MFKAIGFVASDIAVMTKRNLIRYLRLPRLIVFSTIQPVMLLLLFTYVFGGAIEATIGRQYLDYLLPGVLLQAVLFGSIQTGIGLADDLSRGMIERFRALPMARSAVLAGRTISDTLRNLFVIILMVAVGDVLGFRFHGTPADAFGSLGIALLFGFAFSWVAATIGLTAKDTETAQVAGFLWVFPLVFASSIFVPVETMPTALQAFAEVNPITAAVDAVRGLALGNADGEVIVKALLWIIGILAVFVPLAVYRYRRAV